MNLVLIRNFLVVNYKFFNLALNTSTNTSKFEKNFDDFSTSSYHKHLLLILAAFAFFHISLILYFILRQLSKLSSLCRTFSRFFSLFSSYFLSRSSFLVGFSQTEKVNLLISYLISSHFS